MIRQLMYLLIPMVVPMLASCSGEDYQDMETIHSGGTQQICFEMVYAMATVEGAPKTRVATSTDGQYNSTWTNGDEVGIYIVKGNGGLQTSGNWVDNMKMIYNNGNWTYTFPSGTGYYPLDGDKLHFYAYYPYVSGLTDATNFTFSVQADQRTAANLSKSDLLMASKPNVGKNGSPVQLVFSHVMTMVEMSATSGSVGGQLSASVVPTLEGCRTNITANLATGTVSASGSAVAVTMYRVEQSGDANYYTSYTYRALVPEQNVPAGTEMFRFTQTQGTITRSLSHKPSTQVALSGGEVKPFNITLQPTIDPAHVYVVGDYYPYKGLPIIGVVFEVSNGGKNGKIIDLDYIQRYAPAPDNAMAPIRWGDPTVDEQAAGVVGIRDMNDGSSGTRNLIIKRKDQPDFTSVYCLFNWIYLTKNNGDVNGMWYLPAVNEMILLHTQLNGGLSAKIESIGGRSLSTRLYSRVLTETDMANAYYVTNNLYQALFTKDGANWDSATVAIAKF